MGWSRKEILPNVRGMEMIEWGPLVKSLGYDSEMKMWEDLYTTRKLSVAQISRKLDISRNIVRNALGRSNIELRGRGGPNNARVVLTKELLDEIRLDGIAVVAKRLKLDYTTLYKRLYKRGLTVKGLRLLEAPSPVGTDATVDVD